MLQSAQAVRPDAKRKKTAAKIEKNDFMIISSLDIVPGVQDTRRRFFVSSLFTPDRLSVKESEEKELIF